jgi:ADP-ribose pyrophosphatase
MQKPKKKITSKVVHKNPFYQIRKDTYVRNNNKKGEYYVVSVNPFVIICALSKDRKKVQMIKNWRYPLNRFNWELPAGIVDKNETPLMAAKRELFEETGLKAKKWKSLGWFFISPGNSNQKGYIYLAESIEKEKGAIIDQEIAGEKRVSLTKLKKMIEQKKVLGAPTLIALQKLQDHLDKH